MAVDMSLPPLPQTRIGNYWQAFEPAPDIGLAEYAIRKIFNEHKRPFDFLAFPHLIACGGPMDSFDSSMVREIALQWGTRLGKTFFVLCGAIYLAENSPSSMMLAGPDESTALKQTERIVEMGKQIPALKESGIDRTLKSRLRFGGNTIYAAWSRSAATLSDVNILYGGACELDLWERVSTSKHPDPEDMFRSRFKDNYAVRKVVFESVPTLAGTYENEDKIELPRSRIEAKRLQGSDCKFWVGCPECGEYQVLAISNVTAEGYLCCHCEQVIPDEKRKSFIRSGVWVPRGCGVHAASARQTAALRIADLEAVTDLNADDPACDSYRERIRWGGWSNCDYITGKPDNDCELATYQLSSLYALSLTWKGIDNERSEDREFVCQWLGETFHPVTSDDIDVEAEAKILAPVITGELPRNAFPDWCEYRILTCDRQKRTFPWQITGWDAALDRCYIIDAGVVLTFTELEQILKRRWNDDPLSIALIDSGYLSSETYDWCLRQARHFPFRIWPVKGDKASVVKLDYKPVEIEDEAGRKSTYRGIRRVHINTQSTQEWITRFLEDRKLLRLWKEKAIDHQELCIELLNEKETVGRQSSTWDRILTSKPNDQRDNLRYAYVGAQICRDKVVLDWHQQEAVSWFKK